MKAWARLEKIEIALFSPIAPHSAMRWWKCCKFDSSTREKFSEQTLTNGEMIKWDASNISRTICLTNVWREIALIYVLNVLFSSHSTTVDIVAVIQLCRAYNFYLISFFALLIFFLFSLQQFSFFLDGIVIGQPLVTFHLTSPEKCFLFYLSEERKFSSDCN